MSKYTSVPQRESATDDKPKQREMCGVPDCISRFIGNGKPRQRGFADVAFTLADGTRIARCCYHYDLDLHRARAGRWSDIAMDEQGLTVDRVNAYQNTHGGSHVA